MNYLVTGGHGFAGLHLVDLLRKEGHNVFTCQKSMDTYPLDGMDGVFNLGAKTHPPTSFDQPVDYFVANTVSVVNMCDKIPKDCVFMQCSTSEVYGIQPEGIPITEDTPLQPISPYATSKACADMWVQERMKNGYIKGFITRAFSHTGPGRPSNYSISSDAYQIARILEDKQGSTIRVGNLEAKRNVMDVRDVVDVYYRLMNHHEQGEIYNICGNKLRAIGEYLDIMLDIYNLKGKVALVKDKKLFRPIDIPVQNPDCTKLQNHFAWEPKIPIEQTLKDLVEYWRGNVD